MPSPHPPEVDAASIESLLLGWQSTADPGRLHLLVAAIRALVEAVAAAALHRRGIHDSFAVDETVSLVFDHLRRLPGPLSGERLVTPFAPRRTTRLDCSLIDQGQSYVVWLARERAADVARSRRRHARSTLVFSELDRPAASHLRHRVAAADGEDTPGQADRCGLLRDVIPRLPPRERAVITLLLEGKTQAVIAHMLEVCEGTVSRIRGRALAALRDLLAE